MKSITDVIADLVTKTTPDLEDRLEAQAEALRETECTDPLIGQWIDAHDVKYLLSTFALSDKDFAAKFPEMPNTTVQARQHVMASIEAHFDECKHCSLKRGYDLELDARIKQVCQQNNDSLLQQMEEDVPDTAKEDDHQSMKLETAIK